MRDLRYYFKNTFNDKKISIDELYAFSTDHLGRLSAQNGSGEWTARIAASSAAMSVFEGAVDSDVYKAGLRKARKAAKDQFRSTIPGKVDLFLAGVKRVYPDQPLVLEEFLPEGFAPFHQAPDDRILNHLNRLVTAAEARVADLGQPLVDEATDLRDAWQTIHDASEVSSAQKALTEAEKREARADLQKELFITLLHLVLKYPDDDSKLGLYMQPHLLGGVPLTTTPGTGGGGGGGDPESSEASEPSSSSSPSSMDDSSSSSSSYSSFYSSYSPPSSSELSSFSSSSTYSSLSSLFSSLP